MIGVMLCHIVDRFGTEEQRQAFLPELTSMVYKSYTRRAVEFLQAVNGVDYYLFLRAGSISLAWTL